MRKILLAIALFWVVAANAASIINFTHQYPATSGTGYAMGASANIDDYIVLFTGNSGTSGHSTAVLSGATGTFVENTSAFVTVSNKTITCLVAHVTGSGTPTIAASYSSGGGDLGWSAWIVRGLTGTAAAASSTSGTASPLTVSLSPSSQSSLLIFWLNEQGNNFTSWNGSIALDEHDTSHWDAAGHQLGVAAGSYTPGANVTSNSLNELSAIYMVETGGGGGSISNFNGLASGSTATLNGLAIGSVATKNGVTAP